MTCSIGSNDAALKDRSEYGRGVPESPEMQALAERLEEILVGAALSAIQVLAASALRTVTPPVDSLIGCTVAHVERRGKYVKLRMARSESVAMLFHLGQAGRLDIEQPPRSTKRGGRVRLSFEDAHGEAMALLIREYGTDHKVAWWVLADGDEGPLAKLGPEATSEAAATRIREATETQRTHAWLREQSHVAGLGRGHTDDALWMAGVSPLSSIGKLTSDQREAIIEAIRHVLDLAVARERQRTGGLSDAKLGERFFVHGRAGEPCLKCGGDLRRISYASHEVVYCPDCQTGGRVLADRRRSRLLR